METTLYSRYLGGGGALNDGIWGNVTHRNASRNIAPSPETSAYCKIKRSEYNYTTVPSGLFDLFVFLVRIAED